MNEYWFIIIMFSFYFAIIAAILANRYNRCAGSWSFFGWLFGPLAIFALLAAGIKPNQNQNLIR